VQGGQNGVYPSSQAFAAGDYNNDGALDLVVAMGNQFYKAAIYLNNKNGTYTEMSNVNYTLPDDGQTYHGRCAAFVDYDRDGWIDLLFLRDRVNEYDNTLFALFRNNHSGRFTNVTPNANLVVAADTTDMYGFAVADYDNDGDPDFYAPRPGSASLYMRNDNGVFHSAAAAAGLPATSGYIGAAAIDYNNDGWFDLFLKKTAGGPELYLNDKDGTFTNVSVASGVLYVNCGSLDLGESGFGGSLTVEDFDNDGYSDILLLNKSGPNTKFFHNKGNGTFEEKIQSTGLLPDSYDWYWAAPCGDYNRDGYPDIFMGNGYCSAANPVYATLFRNNGGSNKWLGLKLTGVQSNKSAIGARVLAYKSGVIQTRQVTGGDGYKVNSFTLHFGLGASTDFDSIRIYWPSGIVQRLFSVPSNQILKITEKDTTLYFGPLYIGGEVRHIAQPAQKVRQAYMAMTGDETRNQMTTLAGLYKFTPINAGNKNLTVTPSKPRGEDVGATAVTAYDAALVLRSVLRLDDAFGATQRLAAHVVTDTTAALDASDAAFIARYAVGLKSDARSRAGQWFFKPSVRTYASVWKFYDHDDFQAMVLGDVSLNWGGAATPGKAAAVCGPASAVECAADSAVIEVPLVVEAGSGMLAADLALRFDPASLMFLSAEPEGPAAGFSTVWNEETEGFVKIAAYGSRPVTEAGRVLTLRFLKVRPQGDTAIRWEAIAVNERPSGPAETLVHFAGIGSTAPGPARFGLLGGYPNPFNPATSLLYGLDRPAEVSITVVDLRGREVAVLFLGPGDPGEHAVRWNGLDGEGNEAPSGVYFCRLESGGRASVLKMLKAK
jgi:hypothetical protein